MAIELSIDGGNRQRQVKSAGTTGGAAGLFAQLTTLAVRLGQAAQASFERIRGAQARGSKRKQMRLVESLALGNRRQLLLIVCDNQRYLVGIGADSVGSILAIEVAPVSRDRARGPELVRHRGREAGQDTRPGSTEEPGLNLWH